MSVAEGAPYDFLCLQGFHWEPEKDEFLLRKWTFLGGTLHDDPWLSRTLPNSPVHCKTIQTPSFLEIIGFQ